MQNRRQRRAIKREMPSVGTHLRGKTKGHEVYAEVISDQKSRTGIAILFEGKIYQSMSAAARAATGYSCDGWLFWKIPKD